MLATDGAIWRPQSPSLYSGCICARAACTRGTPCLRDEEEKLDHDTQHKKDTRNSIKQSVHRTAPSAQRSQNRARSDKSGAQCVCHTCCHILAMYAICVTLHSPLLPWTSGFTGSPGHYISHARCCRVTQIRCADGACSLLPCLI